MRWLSVLLSLVICHGTIAQVADRSDSIGLPNSENGWYLAPHGTIRILVIFAEIDYDKVPSQDPQPEPTVDWLKGQLPAWKDDLFDPFPLEQPKAMVSRYYSEISLGGFVVLGDYLDHVVIIRQSEHKNLRDLSGLAWGEANKFGALHTAHDLSMADFDMWTDGGKPGKPKVNRPDIHPSYDHVMVILRNSSLTHGQGSTDAGSAGLLFGYPSDTQSRFGAMNGLPFAILKHEFNHLLLGGNNFHSGGGNAPQFDSYILCDQGGWSMMGAANSSLLTCSAWDRDRLGWKADGAPYRINVHDQDGAYRNGDLDPLAGDTGLFILKDLIPSGDAMRIRMPFLPDNVYQQWLWIENHQTTSRNGSPTDQFHWTSTNNPCLSNAVPGLYMTMQIEREEKVGNNIYGGSADYLHPLTASGHYDVILTTDTIRASCPFHGQTIAYRLRTRWENPLSGNCEQELVVYDRNKDGKVERGEHFVMGAGYRPNGSFVDDAGMFGAARHAWTADGERVLGLATNPSSANMLTLRCNGKQEYNKGVPPDNRAIYLNGIRVELVEQRANGDIAVRVSTGDTRLEEHVRWCADSIVLPPLHGKDGNALTVARGGRLLLDRSRTPTRMDLQEEVKGYSYFAPPTRFTVTNGARMLLEPKSELRLENGSELHLMPGSELIVEGCAKLKVDRSSHIVVHGDAKLDAKASTLRKLRRKGRLTDADGSGPIPQ